MSLAKTHPSAAKVTETKQKCQKIRKIQHVNNNFGFGTDILREFDQSWVSNFRQVSLIYYMPLQFALFERQMSIVVGVICQAS